MINVIIYLRSLLLKRATKTLTRAIARRLENFIILKTSREKSGHFLNYYSHKVA